MGAFSNDREFFEFHARQIFVDLNLAHFELWFPEIWDRVLDLVRRREFDYQIVGRFARVAEKIEVRPQYTQWVGAANSDRESFDRICTHALVRTLRVLVGTRPRFGCDNTGWVFLGRSMRNLVELPLGQNEDPEAARSRVIDMWGSPDGRAIQLRASGGLGVIVGISERSSWPSVEEAFRRLRRKRVLDAAD